MAWTHLFLTDDFTRSGNVLTFLTTPSDDDTYLVYYSYLDLTDSTGHSHAMERRLGGWNGGSTWALGHQPDGQQLRVLKGTAAALRLWVAYSSSGSGADLTVRSRWINRTTGADFGWETAGVACNASGNATESPTVMRCMADDGDGPVFLATYDSATNIVRVYRVDNSTLTSTWSQDLGDTGSIADMYVEADGTIWLAMNGGADDGGSPEANFLYDGVWRSTDGGANFTRVHNGRASNWDRNGSGVMDFGSGTWAIWVDEDNGRIWTGHGDVQGGGAGLGSLLSYSDNDGVNWADVQTTGSGNSLAIDMTLTGSPYRSGDRVSFSFQASSAGGFAMGYVTYPAVVTMLTEFKAGADSTSAERAFFDDPTKRVLVQMRSVDAGEVHTSADSGDTWTERQDLGGGAVSRGISIHAETHFVAVAVPANSTVAISTDRGVTFDTFDLPASRFCRLVAWADGY